MFVSVVFDKCLWLERSRLLLAKNNVLSRELSHDSKIPTKRQHTVSESEVKDSQDKDEVRQL